MLWEFHKPWPISTLEQYAFQAFADALEAIPMALEDNSNLAAVDALAEAKASQLARKTPALGIDCMNIRTLDMKSQNVIESLKSKTQQILLMTKLVKMVLKIDDVRSPANH